MYADVTAITGDREFPDDLREKMMTVLATVSLYQPHLEVPEQARELALCCRYSRAIEDMHELHHELAGRRIETRFGWLCDDLVSNRKRRDEHDSPSEGPTEADEVLGGLIPEESG